MLITSRRSSITRVGSPACQQEPDHNITRELIYDRTYPVHIKPSARRHLSLNEEMELAEVTAEGGWTLANKPSVLGGEVLP